MRHSSRLAAIGAGVLLAAATAGAQNRNDPYRNYDPRYDNDERGYGGGRQSGAYRGDLIDRVLSDLDRSQYAAGGDRHQWKELEQARRDLVRFRENWMRGRFDHDRIDGAIHHLDRLVGSRWLEPRARDILGRDLYALRDFRAGGGYNRGDYGRR
jgi:hypothetical protein